MVLNLKSKLRLLCAGLFYNKHFNIFTKIHQMLRFWKQLLRCEIIICKSFKSWHILRGGREAEICTVCTRLKSCLSSWALGVIIWWIHSVKFVKILIEITWFLLADFWAFISFWCCGQFPLQYKIPLKVFSIIKLTRMGLQCVLKDNKNGF